MQRRMFTLAVGTLGFGALAGCLGDDEGESADGGSTDDETETGGADGADDEQPTETESTPDDDATDEETGTEDGPPDEERATEHIETATAEIQLAIDLLIEAIDNDDTQLDGSSFHGHLDAAEENLDEAAPLATDEQGQQIDDLSAMIEYLSLRGDAEMALDTGFDDPLASGLDEYWTGREHHFQEDVGVSELEQATERFEEAEQSFADAGNEFAQAREYGQEAKSVLDGISPDVVDTFEDLTYDDAVGEAENLIGLMEELERFTDAVGEGSLAWSHASMGFINIEQEEWEQAQAEFEAAKTAFESAVETLEDLPIEDDLAFLLEFFSELLCEVGEGPAATDHWIGAAEAAQEGDQQTHEEEINAGLDVMTACHEG